MLISKKEEPRHVSVVPGYSSLQVVHLTCYFVLPLTLEEEEHMINTEHSILIYYITRNSTITKI
jgi:hypothetical protein